MLEHALSHVFTSCDALLNSLTLPHRVSYLTTLEVLNSLAFSHHVSYLTNLEVGPTKQSHFPGRCGAATLDC